MGNISPQKLVTLISQYLDREKLMKENPSVTKEMIDALLHGIFMAKQGKEPTDTQQPHHDTVRHKQEDVTDLVIHTDGASREIPARLALVWPSLTSIIICLRNYASILESPPTTLPNIRP